MSFERKRKDTLVSYSCAHRGLKRRLSDLNNFIPVLTAEVCRNELLFQFLNACKTGNIDEVRDILKQNCPAPSLRRKQTFLIGTARKNNNINNQNEIQKGTTLTVNDTTSNNWGAVHIACFYSQIEVFQLLLQHGVDVRMKTDEEWTPLFICAMKNSVNFLEKLISYDPKGVKLQSSCITPLHVASLMGNTESVSYLLSAGVDLGVVDSDGMSPLYYSYSSENPALPNLIFSYYIPQTCTQLILSGCGMYSLPEDEILESLVFLEVLDVSNNNLQFLSPVLSMLGRLRSVSFQNNPFMSIPSSLRNTDWNTMKAYLHGLYRDFQCWNTRCCIVVGDKQTGKSTLINNISSLQNSGTQKFLTKRKVSKLTSSGNNSNNNNNNISSELLDFEVKTTTQTCKKGIVNIEFWEISNNLIKSPLHQLLTLGHSIVVIVFNLESLALPFLDYWMNISKPILGYVPILLIGTHSDNNLCTENHIQNVFRVLRERYPKQRYPGLADNNFFAVNISIESAIAVKERIGALILGDYKYFPKLSKVNWMGVVNLFRFSDTKYIYCSVLFRWLDRYFNIKVEQMNEILEFLQSTGAILFLGSAKNENSNFVVTDKAWFMNQLVQLVHKNPLIKSGIVRSRNLFVSIPGFEIDADCIFYLLEKYKIAFPLPIQESVAEEERTYFIPCSLTESKPKHIVAIWPVFPQMGQYECQRIYCFTDFQNVVFARIVADLFYLPDITDFTVWLSGAIFTFNRKYRLKITYQLIEPEHQILISLRYPQDEVARILRAVLEIIENLIQTSYPNLLHSMRRLIPCVHCLMRRTLTVDPHLFTYEECVSTMTSGLPILFCNNILSPTRCVRIDKLAPDISFADVKQVREKDFKIIRVIGKGGCGVVSFGLLKIDRKNIKDDHHSTSDLPLSQTPQFDNQNNIINNNTDDDTSSNRSLLRSSNNSYNNNNNVNSEDEWRSEECTEIAIKELTGFNGGFEQSIDSFGDFVREVYIMSYLNHPNLVNMFGVCLKPPLLIMEYVPCGDLFQLLQTTKTEISIEFISKVAFDISLGMNYLHSITPPIIHRDLRSPNIFLMSLDPNEKICAKVADFGLSRVNISNKVQGTLGSWQWMAPETLDINGDEVEYNEKVDVYSFGVIIWEMFTKAFPFDEYLGDPMFSTLNPRGEKTFKLTEIKKAIVSRGLRPTIPPHVPRTFVSLMKSCWEADPSSRPDFKQIASIFNTSADREIDSQFTLSANQLMLPIGNELLIADEKIDEPTFQSAPLSFIKDLVINITDAAGASTKAMSPFSLVVVEDRVWVGCKDGTIIIYDNRPSKQKEEESRWKAHDGSVVSMLFARDYYVWTVGSDGYIKIYPPHAKWTFDLKYTLQPKVKVPFRCAYLFSNSKTETVWVGSPEKRMILIWDVETKEMLKTIQLDHHRPVFDMVWFKGLVWVASFEIVISFDPETYEQKGIFEAHPKSMVNSLTTAHDYIWTAGNREIHIWDLKNESTTLRQSLSGHISKVLCLTTINNQVWSGSFDKTIIVWDSVLMSPITELEAHDDSIRTIFPVDDNIWSLGFDPKIVVWKGIN